MVTQKRYWNNKYAIKITTFNISVYGDTLWMLKIYYIFLNNELVCGIITVHNKANSFVMISYHGKINLFSIHKKD